MLCYYRQLQRRFTVGKLVQRRSVKGNFTVCRLLHTVNAFQKGTFAAAVRPDNAHKFLIMQAEIYSLKNFLWSEGHFYCFC